MMSDYLERKQLRTALYDAKHGVKMVVCSACSGSGYYDARNSPKCGACNGKGKHYPSTLERELYDIQRSSWGLPVQR